MRLIIDVPDELVPAAFELAMEESKDYARRYDRPGWGWTYWKAPNRYWVRGIKGGLSVSLCRPAASPAIGSSNRLAEPKTSISLEG